MTHFFGKEAPKEDNAQTQEEPEEPVAQAPKEEPKTQTVFLPSGFSKKEGEEKKKIHHLSCQLLIK